MIRILINQLFSDATPHGSQIGPCLLLCSGSSKLKPKSDGGAAEVVGVLPECNEECGRVDVFQKSSRFFCIPKIEKS